jgi:hypothetical protein
MRAADGDLLQKKVAGDAEITFEWSGGTERSSPKKTQIFFPGDA